ncbi:hypothetical protein ACQ86N_25465 [Puia sp. P3]|uniref:hypothetical protein n=1 Tax=Puia sp. P3 TaxID=3423952 RepID=UPI003D67BC8B
MCVLLPFAVAAQTDWPREIAGADGAVIRVYHPQPDSLAGNVLKLRAAFSVVRRGETEPRYGSFVALNGVETDRNERTLSLLSSNVLSLRFSEWMAADSLATLKETIECGLPGIGYDISLDRLIAFMDRPAGGMGKAVVKAGQVRLENTPPRIIFSQRPSMLVMIDGVPRLRLNKDWGIRVVANSPYAIAESTDGWYYLYGRHRWYVAPMPAGPYLHSGYYPRDLMWMKADIDDLNGENEVFADTMREENAGIRDIVVSTTAAELIQTQGRLYSGR